MAQIDSARKRASQFSQALCDLLESTSGPTAVIMTVLNAERGSTMRASINTLIAATIFTSIIGPLSPNVGAEEHSVIGVWRLASYLREDPTRGEELSKDFSDNTGGSLIYTRGGRMMVLLKAANLVAYSGTYKFSEDKIVHHVELSNIPDFIGYDLERKATISGKSLTLIAHSMFSDQKYTLVWERIER